MSDTEEGNLTSFLKEDSVSSEQREFNDLSSNAKLERLNHLIKQTEVYSQIILDNMLEKSLEKKKLQKRQDRLRKRESRQAARKKYEEQKELAIKEGRAEPQLPDILLSDSEPESDPEDERPPTPKLEEQPEEASDSDLEVLDVKQTRKRRAARKGGRSKKMQKPMKESSKKIRETRKAIESAQTAHSQLQPKLVTGCDMKDYQLDGLEWLVTLYENGLNGILADEMGLGKTLQCISLICYLLEHKVKGPFLIVAPLSTVNNWCNEFEKFAPSVKVIKYTGPKESRQTITFNKKLRGKVVITSYEIVIRDFIKVSRVSWSYLTVDEGHRLKNFECLLIQKLKRVDAANRLLLTGTPLQNNLNELWSLLNFILPDIFGDLELFQLWFNFEEFVSGNEDDDRMLKEDVRRKLVKSLHSILKPFLLRRLKINAMKTLPPKKEYIVYADLTPVQRAFYAAIVQGDIRDSVTELHAKELLIKNHPEKFTKPEHLDPVQDIIRLRKNADKDVLEEANGKATQRDRRQVYSRKLLKNFENGNLDALDYLSDSEASATEEELSEEITSGDEDYHDASETQNVDSETSASDKDGNETKEDESTTKADENGHQEIEPSPKNEQNGEKSDHLVVSTSLQSDETLEGEALQREVEKQTQELENALMMGVAAEEPETPAENGAVLEFHPKDQEVLRVKTTSREWIPYRASGPTQNGITREELKKSSLNRKLQKTLHDVILGDHSNDTSNGGSKKRRRRPLRGKRARSRVQSISDELDIEVIEIKDDSDLSEEEKRRELCLEAVDIARRHVVHQHLQNTVMQLRKVCGSHYTFFEPYVVHNELDEFDPAAVKDFLEKILEHSGKLQLFNQLLDKLMDDGHKVLVFSQFQKMLDVIEIVLTDKGIPFNRLDGATSQDEREDAMNEFKEEGDDSSKVFLLSTRAGGLGLNLVSADTVILFDSDWNPQMDLQAIDRLHRIGQTNPVKIFRLVVRNTVEELLIVKSFSKRLLERMVIQLGQFQLGRVAKKLAEEKIDLEKFTSIRSILDIGNRLDLYGSHEDEFNMKNSSSFLLTPPPHEDPLTQEEMHELMDRSRDCYARNPLDTKFANVTPFESTNTAED
ncbi:hypothetical protein C7M61_001453 [Candidozyma pseudohaemuli]|uniref:Uncharacterized protein n=1 Tax=Candidozyma pseudohaemuli TaxID=418784 RepID=A0A2P7YUK9_9ASCO|nr:hypothetical protein C7M61_001453 [[Candida] pseudohaemulonii]PSK39651.1 hypothetical protein C7M61_001453 [[Candida] pseudohaemulonii]